VTAKYSMTWSIARPLCDRWASCQHCILYCSSTERYDSKLRDIKTT